MTPRAALTQLGKLVAMEMSAGRMSDGLKTVGEALASDPDAVLDVLDLFAAESRKKKPNDALAEAFAFMLGQVLEIFRFGVERDDLVSIAAVEAVKNLVQSLVQQDRLAPGHLLLILCQFSRAKLEMGDELKSLMAGAMERGFGDRLAPQPPGIDAIGKSLADMARNYGGDVFALQADVAEHLAAFPDDHRSTIVAALMEAQDPLLREAVPGWLLDQSDAVRRNIATLLLRAAGAGQVSGTMLRRMITLRNWLPEAERATVDAIIRTCRQKGVECASYPSTTVRDVIASAIDGTGAQSIFIIVREGRKHAAAALLLKRGIGVRDAWVRPAMSKAETEQFMAQLETQIDSYDCTMDYVRLALGHSLAVVRQSGVLPPFGLVDVIEKAGLSSVNPEEVDIDGLLAQLLGDIPDEFKAPGLVAAVLKDSAAWVEDFSFVETWFEDDGRVNALMEARRLSAKRRVALLLTAYFPSRRAVWAETMAWMAFTMRQDETTDDDWIELALVAKELRGDRPLQDIPVMARIAETTVLAWEARSQL